MNEYCENPLCQNRSTKNVPVSVDKPSDQKRSLCATCQEACTWGVQHGRMSSGGFRIEPPPTDEGPEATYRVVYTIDVNAPDPKQAARCAYEIMTDPGSLQPVLYVLDCKGTHKEIDLSEDANEAN